MFVSSLPMQKRHIALISDLKLNVKTTDVWLTGFSGYSGEQMGVGECCQKKSWCQGKRKKKRLSIRKAQQHWTIPWNHNLIDIQLGSSIITLQNSNIHNEKVKSSIEGSIMICISVLNMSRLSKTQLENVGNVKQFFQRHKVKLPD